MGLTWLNQPDPIMPEGVLLSESDDKVHDLCRDCHDPDSGQLIGSAAGREGNTTNKCIDCHGGPTRFLAHLHHESLNKVSYDNGVNDTSQSGQQGCQDCHGSGPQGGPYSLASWSDILFAHNNSCYTCHDYANEPNVGDDTPLLADVQAAIANPGSGVALPATYQRCRMWIMMRLITPSPAPCEEASRR